MEQFNRYKWVLNGVILALACAGLLVSGAVLGGVIGFCLALLVLLALVAFAVHYFVNFMIRRPKDHPIQDAGTNRQRARRQVAELERHRREQGFIEQLIPYNPEEWTVQSEDGLRLHGVFVPGESGEKRAVLLLHGHRQSASQMAEYALFFREELGMNALMPDARAHGQSEGRHIGMGWPERRDALRWMDSLTGRLGGETQILIYGISMGAATAMMTAGEPDVPKQLRFIAEDCGYSGVEDEVRYQLKDKFQLPPFPILPLGRIVIRKKAGYDIRTASSLEQLKKSSLPVLFIHGDADDYVPYRMVRPLYEAAPTRDKELITLAGAGHVKAFPEDDGRVRDALKRYIDRFMPSDR